MYYTDASICNYTFIHHYFLSAPCCGLFYSRPPLLREHKVQGTLSDIHMFTDRTSAMRIVSNSVHVKPGCLRKLNYVFGLQRALNYELFVLGKQKYLQLWPDTWKLLQQEQIRTTKQRTTTVSFVNWQTPLKYITRTVTLLKMHTEKKKTAFKKCVPVT